MEIIDNQFATKLIGYGPTIMITAYDEEKQHTTGMTCQWHMPIDENHIMVKMGCRSYTSKCMRKTNKFVINVPTTKIKEQMIFFGRNSGETIDKFKETNLHLEECSTEGFGKLIISECCCCIELELVKLIEDISDHSYCVVGKVKSTKAKPSHFKDGEFKFSKSSPIEELPMHHYGADKFGVICFD